MDERIDFGFDRYVHQLVGAVLERLCVPFLLLARDGSVLFCNPMAQAILAQRVHLSIEKGHLACRSENAAAIIGGFLDKLASNPEEIDFVIPGDSNEEPVYASLSPFEPPRHDLLGEIAPLAVLFIRDGNEAEAIEVARLKFGLTAAEVAIVKAVMRNVSAKAFAAERNVSIHTARKQMSSAMRKLGARTQLQLQSIIAALRNAPGQPGGDA